MKICNKILNVKKVMLFYAGLIKLKKNNKEETTN